MRVMNATQKAKILRNAGYIDIKTPSDYQWYWNDVVISWTDDKNSFSHATSAAYQHYLDNQKQAEAISQPSEASAETVEGEVIEFPVLEIGDTVLIKNNLDLGLPLKAKIFDIRRNGILLEDLNGKVLLQEFQSSQITPYLESPERQRIGELESQIEALKAQQENDAAYMTALEESNKKLKADVDKYSRMAINTTERNVQLQNELEWIIEVMQANIKDKDFTPVWMLQAWVSRLLKAVAQSKPEQAQAEGVTLSSDAPKPDVLKKWKNKRRNMFADGYYSFIDPIDSEVAREYPCDKCKGKNMYGEGFKDNDSYRAFAICPDCGHFGEF